MAGSQPPPWRPTPKSDYVQPVDFDSKLIERLADAIQLSGPTRGAQVTLHPWAELDVDHSKAGLSD